MKNMNWVHFNMSGCPHDKGDLRSMDVLLTHLCEVTENPSRTFKEMPAVLMSLLNTVCTLLGDYLDQVNPTGPDAEEPLRIDEMADAVCQAHRGYDPSRDYRNLREVKLHLIKTLYNIGKVNGGYGLKESKDAIERQIEIAGQYRRPIRDEGPKPPYGPFGGM